MGTAGDEGPLNFALGSVLGSALPLAQLPSLNQRSTPAPPYHHHHPPILLVLGRAAGREPLWVDLEADPVIDRDNPPDLKAVADAAAPLAADGGDAGAAPAAAPKKAAAGKAAASKKGGAAAAAPPAASQRPDDVLRLTDELVATVRCFCWVLG